MSRYHHRWQTITCPDSRRVSDAASGCIVFLLCYRAALEWYTSMLRRGNELERDTSYECPFKAELVAASLRSSRHHRLVFVSDDNTSWAQFIKSCFTSEIIMEYIFHSAMHFEDSKAQILVRKKLAAVQPNCQNSQVIWSSWASV